MRNPAVAVLTAIYAYNGTVEVVDDQLRVIMPGTITDQMRHQIAAHKTELIDYLQKKCMRCISPSIVKAYWGELFCSKCVIKIVAELDQKNTWPEWPDKGAQ